jgi:hypothetical protein
MLVYKAQQVVACTKLEPKPWEMAGRSGVTHAAKLAVLGVNGDVENIKLKSKTAEELVAKVGKFTIGKAAEVPIFAVIPVFKQGDRKPSSYEFEG